MDWFHFNDSTYEHVDVEDEIKSPSAYVLFYNKMTTLSKSGTVKYSRQSVSLPHLWPHLIDGGGEQAAKQTPIKEVINEAAETLPHEDDAWEPLTTSDGRTYFHNVKTGQTAWEKPSV